MTQNTEVKKLRKARRKAGICVQCGKHSIAKENGSRCQYCLDRRALKSKRRRERAAEMGRQEAERQRVHDVKMRPYLESAENLWTAAKWLARATGTGYKGSDQASTDAVFGPFWAALPNGSALLMENALAGLIHELPRVIVSEAQADVAFQAGLMAFRQYAEREPVLPLCPQCGDAEPNNRRGNDYKCRKCGWEAPEGSFGAIYVASHAGSSR